jgi:hypothetical protein
MSSPRIKASHVIIRFASNLDGTQFLSYSELVQLIST